MIKVGIVGLGGMGRTHIKLIKECDGIDVVAASEIDIERIKKTEPSCDFTIYKDLDVFLRIDDLDYVIVSTPNHTHEEIAIKALSAGKNVIIDKPMTVDYESALRIFNEAQKATKDVFVFHSRRWDPDFLKIIEIINSGMLGDLLEIQSSLYYKIWDYKNIGDTKAWRLDKDGGGILMDWAPHLIDQILLLMNSDPVHVYGLTQQSVKNSCIDDYFLGILEFEDNIFCKIEARNNERLKVPRWYIVGTKGTLLVENKKRYKWDEIIIEYEDENGEEVKRKFELPDARTLSEDIYKDFVKFVKGEKDKFIDIDESMRVMKIMDLIRLSSTEKGLLEYNYSLSIH